MGKRKNVLFIQPPKIILYLLARKPREFVIYCYLLDRRGKRNSTWVTEETIGKHCRVSERTVRTAIRYLESLGLIRTALIAHDPLTGEKFSKKRNQYYFNDPIGLFGIKAKGADWEDFRELIKNFSLSDRQDISAIDRQDTSKSERRNPSKSRRKNSPNHDRQNVADKLYSTSELDPLKKELDQVNELHTQSESILSNTLSESQTFNFKSEEIDEISEVHSLFINYAKAFDLHPVDEETLGDREGWRSFISRVGELEDVKKIIKYVCKNEIEIKAKYKDLVGPITPKTFATRWGEVFVYEFKENAMWTEE